MDEHSGELDRLLREMRPFLHEEAYAFCVVFEDSVAGLPFEPLGVFREDEGTTIVAPAAEADKEKLAYSGRWAHITLMAETPLHTVGFLAIITGALARAGVAVNPVSAYHHDHLFVPWEKRGEAMEVLEKLGTREEGNGVYKRFSETSRSVLSICRALLEEPAVDAGILNRDNVPDEAGLYLWRWKNDGCPAYIGIALGRRGLRQRIVEQHLRPSYRKSVFRIAVANDKGLEIGEECVTYIQANFTIVFHPFPGVHKAGLKCAESLLVESEKPQFNKAV